MFLFRRIQKFTKLIRVSQSIFSLEPLDPIQSVIKKTQPFRVDFHHFLPFLQGSSKIFELKKTLFEFLHQRDTIRIHFRRLLDILSKDFHLFHQGQLIFAQPAFRVGKQLDQFFRSRKPFSFLKQMLFFTRFKSQFLEFFNHFLQLHHPHGSLIQILLLFPSKFCKFLVMLIMPAYLLTKLEQLPESIKKVEVR